VRPEKEPLGPLSAGFVGEAEKIDREMRVEFLGVIWHLRQTHFLECSPSYADVSDLGEARVYSPGCRDALFEAYDSRTLSSFPPARRYRSRPFG
jgi:hypothetical protein